MNKHYTINKLRAVLCGVSVLSLVFLSAGAVSAACVVPTVYCQPTITNVANYSIGIQNLTMGTINNTSVATGNNPIYYDYTHLNTKVTPGQTVNFSVRNGGGNSTTVRIWVDWNQDGDFANAAPELMWTSPNQTAGATVSGSFVVPGGLSPGVYRMRLGGTLGGNAATACSANYGEYEDYTLVVAGASAEGAVLGLSSPARFEVGENYIGVRMANLSPSNMTSLKIGYRVDNNSPVIRYVTGINVASGAFYEAVFPLPWTASVGDYSLKVWIDSVNSVTNQSAENDTLCLDLEICNVLSGNYTINPSGAGSTNFTSFTSALQALERCGIGGAVTIEVATGVYTEQLDFFSFYGLSSINNITFKSASGNSGDVVLQFNSATSTANNYVLKFGGDAAYITFRDMTLRNNQNGSWGRILFIEAASHYNKFINVHFEGRQINSTSTNYALVESANTVKFDFWHFDRCKFIYGSYGFYIQSNSSNSIPLASENLRIERCEFLNQYYMGIRIYYFNGIQILDNIINTNSTYTTYYGMYFYWIMVLQDQNKTFIDRNKIYGSAGGHGMYLQYLGVNSSVSAAREFQIANNMINIGNGAAVSTYGIRCLNQNPTNIYHNTVNIRSSQTTEASAAIFLETAYTTNARNNVYNNVFSGSNGAAALRIGDATNSVTNFITDFNVLYSSGSTLAYAGTSPSSNLLQWQNASAKDANSVSIDPRFASISASDLALRNPFLSDIFPRLPAILQDMNGRSRKASGTEPGAIESLYDVELVSADIPAGSYCAGNLVDIDVEIHNHGEFDLEAVYFRVTSNGGVEDYLDTVNVFVPYGDIRSFALTKQLKLSGGTANSVDVKFASSDDNPSNDLKNILTSFVGVAPSGGVLDVVNPTTSIPPSEESLYWIAIPGDSIVYSVSSPSGYQNTDYNIPGGYTVVTSAYTKKSGVVLPPSSASYVHNMATGGKWIVTPPDAFIDSLVVFELKVFNANMCDTVFSQEVLIAPYGKPDFKIVSACIGSEVEFENTSDVQSGYLEYEWDFDNGQTSTQTNGRPVYTTLGIYNVTLKTTTVPYGFVKSITKQVTVTESPIASFDYTSSCFGSPVVLTNTTTSPAGTPTYHWDFGNGQTSSATSPTVNYTTSGMYNVTLTAERNGCVSVAEQSIAMFEQPDADFVLSSGSCANNSFVFENNTTNVTGKVGYLWSFGEGTARSTQETGQYVYTTSGNKNVKLVVTTPLGCKDSVTRTINVISGPTAEFTITGECQNGDILFTSTDAAPVGSAFNWTIDGVAQSGVTVIKQYNSVGSRVASLQVEYANGCVNTVAKPFAVKPSPEADFAVEAVCANREAVLHNKTFWTDGSLNYNWELGAGVTSTSQHPTHSFPAAGSVSVKLTVEAEGGCSDEVTKTVTVNPSPNRCQFEVNYEGDKGFRYYSFKPTDGTNTGAEAGVTYTWYYGNGTSEQGNEGGLDFGIDGNYTVTMRASTVSGCDCEYSQQVVVDRVNVSNVEGLVSFNVYPNPTTGVFRVDIAEPGVVNKGKIEVYDIIGNLVFSTTVAELQERGWIIDLSEESSGIYLVRFTSENKTGVKKIKVTK